MLGHESLGRVLEAPADSGFAAGDLVVGVVRRPDPEPCPACARGEFDFCRNGRYTERGIKELHGYGVRALDGRGRLRGQARPGARAGRDADGADDDRRQGLGPDRADRRAAPTSRPSACWSPAPGRSACWRHCSASSAGSRSTCSTATRTAPSRSSSARLGAHYHSSDVASVAKAAPPDIIIEATGVEQIVAEAMANNAAAGIVCLTGVSPRGRDADHRPRRPQPRHRARERRRLRDGQREPAALRARGRGAGAAPTAAGSSAWSPAACRSRPSRRRVEKQRDDVKVVLDL